MQESFLHYVWQHKKLPLAALQTIAGETITITSVGQPNPHAGPDFFNAQLQIGTQRWAGNVEIHCKSSDWYLHNHETDTAYDSVILHVVYEHDTDVYRKNNTPIPTLALKDYISKDLLHNYQKLFANKAKWINCENQFHTIDTFTVNNWLERLYFERLERKATIIETLLQASKADWEAVLFKLLAKNFGLKTNADSFFSVAQSIDFAIIRKEQSKPEHLEALLFGQANLLENTIEEGYYQQLTKTYQYLKQKYQLSNQQNQPVQFFRLRPPNFPTIRLSQLAMLYHKEQNLFSKLIETNTLEAFYTLFKVGTTSFWETHYTFNKTSRSIKKNLTKEFVDLLLINTIIPIKFCFAKHQGKPIDHHIVTILQAITSENNSIVNKFNTLRNMPDTALNSQALLELKTTYCDKNKCLQCAVGNILISK